MIYTLTLNPCLDYFVNCGGELEFGKTNRAKSAQLHFGGKGINVTMALKNMGVQSKAVVALGGKNGDRIAAELNENNIDYIRFESNGESRINVKINTNDIETEINANGADISLNIQQDIIDFFANLDESDTIILAGSMPKNCNCDFYAKILQAAKCKFKIADCTNKALKSALEQGVFLAKPNIDELCEFFGQNISWNDVPQYAKKLCDMGVQNALVSAGDIGAVLCTQNGKAYKAYAPKGELGCATGAGDTMLAGFVYSQICGQCAEQSLKFAVAAGSAKAFCNGFATMESIITLVDKIVIEEVF